MGDIAERLKWARGITGLSQKRLANAAGLQSDGPVRHLESGLTKTVESGTAVALSAVLGCSVDWLLTGEGDPPNEETLRALSEPGASA